MRLGFARRLRKQLRSIKPELKELGVKWASWMEQVMLYYYYPEKLEKAKHWVHQLAEILVACEQLEAYSNNQRGRDYYGRKQESFVEAFQFLGRLQQQGIITRQVFQTVKCLTAQGAFDAVLKAARGRPISIRERRYLQSL
jgi:hypothetical protein